MPRSSLLDAGRRRSVAHTFALRRVAWVLAALFLGTELLLALIDPVEGNLCAGNRLRSRVQWELARQPDLSLDVLAEEIHGSKAMVLDAMPSDRRVGVSGKELPAVWQWVSRWPDPVIILWGRGHSFEIHGPLTAVTIGERHADWSFAAAAGAVLGKLQPSEVGAIYAYYARTRGRDVPEMLFLDRSGELIFEIVPGDALRQSLRTAPIEVTNSFRQMKLLEQVCEKPG